MISGSWIIEGTLNEYVCVYAFSHITQFEERVWKDFPVISQFQARNKFECTLVSRELKKTLGIKRIKVCDYFMVLWVWILVEMYHNRFSDKTKEKISTVTKYFFFDCICDFSSLWKYESKVITHTSTCVMFHNLNMIYFTIFSDLMFSKVFLIKKILSESTTARVRRSHPSPSPWQHRPTTSACTPN